MSKKVDDRDEVPPAEADKRRDELARRILRTPPEPRGDSKRKPGSKRGSAK